jgi:hypothetical protein
MAQFLGFSASARWGAPDKPAKIGHRERYAVAVSRVGFAVGRGLHRLICSWFGRLRFSSFALLVLGYKTSVWFAVPANPTAEWLARQVIEASE